MANKKNNYFTYFNKLASGKLYSYIALNFLVSLLDGIGLTLFIPLIYLATNDKKTSGDSTNQLHYIEDFFNTLQLPLNLYTILGFMILVFVLKGVLSYCRSIYSTKISQLSARKLRFNLINGLKDLSYEGYTSIDSGIVQNNMTTEANRLIQASTLYLIAIQNIAMLVIYMVLAIFSNWQFSILIAVGGFLTNFIYKFLNKLTIEQASTISIIGRNFHSYLIQSLSNFKYLKATNYYPRYNEKLKKEIIDSESTQYQIGKIAAISDNLREPLIIIIISVVLIFQLTVLNGDMGSMMAALLLFYRSLAHLSNFQGIWNKFLASIPSKDSIEDILKIFSNFNEPNLSNDIKGFGDITIKNLNFNYGERVILDNININIKNKTSIALVGESGAGKTTLANIICGLILPKNGEIKINDQNINSININSFRNHVGYVTQEAVIFDDTLFNNITFFDAKNEENLKRFWFAIESASLTDFVNTYKEKENIPLGNNGILVSGGQKQRISIARELYKDINLMILDEATSALDSETEKFIKDQIDLLQGKFTMIVIAHRLSTIKNVDTIYLMDQGKIVDYGSYEELFNSSTKFRNMVKLQNTST